MANRKESTVGDTLVTSAARVLAASATCQQYFSDKKLPIGKARELAVRDLKKEWPIRYHGLLAPLVDHLGGIILDVEKRCWLLDKAEAEDKATEVGG